MASKKQGVKTIICPNPECKREHGLFWNVGKGGKKVLSYRCDRNTRKVKDADDTLKGYRMKLSLAPIQAPVGTVPADGLPEQWSAARRKQVTESKNLQFILMNK